MSDVYMKYDVIIGGIADDKIYNTIELYQDNLIEKDEALKRLKYYKPNEQICITNQNVIDKYLKFRCEEEVQCLWKQIKHYYRYYIKIILEFSNQTGKSLEESMDYLYTSETYKLISEGVSDMHCKGHIYLAQELMLENGLMYHKGYPR